LALVHGEFAYVQGELLYALVELSPLVLLLGLLGFATIRMGVIHMLSLLAIEDGPHRLLAGGKAGGVIEQLVGVDGRAAPELAHMVMAGRALEEGVHGLGLGYVGELNTTLGEALYEVPE
jgi:hypothetical protein